MIPHSHLNGSLARRAKLRELIRKHGFVSIPDLKEEMQVSESTIRRDLELLEESGEAKRTHGGVFSTGPSSTVRQFETQASPGQWEKKRIAAKAASLLVQDNDTVLLDGGSTTYELARQLIGRSLQIVTNSLPIANLFASNESVDLVFLGGAIHARTGIALGPYTDQMLKSINVQKSFLSVAGINQRGFFNSNMLRVETERHMMERADRTIVVADSTKFGRSSLAFLCDWSRVQTVVVDDQIDGVWKQRVLDAGVELIVAPSDGAAMDMKQEEQHDLDPHHEGAQ